jgi:hypothetical protein
MTEKPKWYVFLTAAYIQEVRFSLLYESYVDHEMYYLQCSKLETHQRYLAVTVDSLDLTSSPELQIPHSAVSYILVDPLNKTLGFRVDPQAADKDQAKHHQ